MMFSEKRLSETTIPNGKFRGKTSLRNMERSSIRELQNRESFILQKDTKTIKDK